MKCSICGNDATHMVALDSLISKIAKQHVNLYAGRCKTCVDMKEK